MDKIDLILNKLDMMETEMKSIKQEILEIKDQTTKMDQHVDFVDGVYEQVKHPLDFVVAKYNSVMRINSNIDEEYDMLDGIPDGIPDTISKKEVDDD